MSGGGGRGAQETSCLKVGALQVPDVLYSTCQLPWRCYHPPPICMYLTQFGCELEALFVCHAGEEESVDGHSLLCILLSLQREELFLTASLLEVVVDCVKRERRSGRERAGD